MGDLQQDNISRTFERPKGWARIWSSLAAAIGTLLGIALLREVHLPFPPALSMTWDTCAQWAVEFSVIYTLVTMCAWILKLARSWNRARGVLS